MPVRSETSGMLCTVPGCGGFIYTVDGSHNKHGTSASWTRRIKQCDRCGAEVETLEQPVNTMRSMFAIDRDFEPANHENATSPD